MSWVAHGRPASGLHGRTTHAHGARPERSRTVADGRNLRGMTTTATVLAIDWVVNGIARG